MRNEQKFNLISRVINWKPFPAAFTKLPFITELLLLLRAPLGPATLILTVTSGLRITRAPHVYNRDVQTGSSKFFIPPRTIRMRKMCQSQQFVTWDRGFCHIEDCITFCRRCSSAAFEKIAVIYRRCLLFNLWQNIYKLKRECICNLKVGTLATVPSLPIVHILLSASRPALSIKTCVYHVAFYFLQELVP